MNGHAEFRPARPRLHKHRAVKTYNANVNLFKARLDRFWVNQDAKYDFTADLTGTGDRSEYENM